MNRSASLIPTVSVVIPTFNRAHLLSRAINSVLAQTFSDLELIVVDDGSTDNTVEVVTSIQDPRIKFIPLNKNCGGNYARNRGIEATCSKLIAFLDSDDEWMSQKLELQLAELKDSGSSIAAVYCEYYEYHETTQRNVNVSAPYQGNVFDQLLKGWCPALSNFVIKRAALEAVNGFDESLPSFQDYDLFLRLAQASYHFVAVNKPLVKKYVHDNHQVSGNWIAKLKGFHLFSQRWEEAMKGQSGPKAYEKWVAQHLGLVKFKQMQTVLSRGDRTMAFWHFLELSRYLPWSKELILKGVILLFAGNGMYSILSKVKNKEIKT